MRSVPAGILALQGVATTRAPLYLVEIRFPGGTGYYSSGDSVSFGGNTYAANRVSISGLESGIIDRKNRNFSRLDIRLDNLADNGSSSFPFTVIEAAANPEDSLVFVHVYSPDAADGVAKVFWGYLGARKYDGNDKYASYTVSFFWDALDALLPTKLVHQAGFDIAEGAAQLSEDGTEEMAIPVVYGAGALKVRPLIYSHWTDGEALNVNAILTGCNGLPMEASYLTGANLWGTTQPIAQTLLLGSSGQAAPTNKTRFPDGAAHPNVAYFFARFLIKNEDKNRADDLKPDDIKANITNGRPLLDTTLPSENAALILKDFLRDPNFSVGLPAALFDSITSTANYVGTRYQMRFEFHEQMSVSETVQYILANFHGFITFENGLIQIKAKRIDETSVATFATVDGGGGARKIHNDYVDTWVKDSSELVNKFSIKYRRKKRNRRWVTLYDPVAQARAGGTQKKEVEDELDQWDNGGVYEEAQAAIIAAIAIREEQNGNLFASWASPIWDCIDISVGDLVTVTTPDVFNNVSNATFRVTKQSFDTDPDGLPLVHFEGQIYKAAIYNDDSVALGLDLLRGGDFTDAQGRPPDVVPVSLNLVDVVTNDVEGRLADMRATWTYPTVDMTTEQADGLFREFPIAEVEIWWRYTDQSINAVSRAGSVKYPSTQLDFQVDFKKTKTVEAFFVAIGHNRARSPLGYVPDSTKTTVLTAILAANPSITASVEDSTAFTVNDYVQCEKEIVQLTSKTATSLTFVSSGGNRTTFFDSIAIAHPLGTEISVAKYSYPSLTKALTGPRFTYPPVTTISVLQRPKGVKVRIEDINTENLESYFVYWSTAGDPGSGSATPSWYTTDPLSPPGGVNIFKGKALTPTIPQEIIGPAGTLVYVRVAARNGKHNWSSALSPLASSAIGDNAVPTVSAAPKLAINKKGVRVKFVLPSTNMETFTDQGKVEISIRAESATPAVLGYLDDSTGPWTSSATEVKINVGPRQHDVLNLAKDHILALWPTAATLYVYIYVSNAVGRSAASPEASINVSTWEVESGAATPGALGTPTITTNTIDGDPTKNTARIIAAVGPASGTFAANNITQVNLIVVKVSSGGTPDATDKQTIIKVLSTEELATSTCDIEFYVVVGQRYRITKVVAINGDRRTQTGSLAVNFTGGSFATDGTCPAPSFFSQPAADGNKIVNFTIRLTNSATPVIFKKLVVEVSYGGGTYRNIEGSPINLRNDDVLNASGVTKDFVITCKRKAGVTLDVRATAVAVGPITSTTTNATQLAANVDDLVQDSAAASAPQFAALIWKAKHGYKTTFWRPATNSASVQRYRLRFRVQTTGNYMNPNDGSVNASPTNTEIYVQEGEYWIGLKKGDMASEVITNGIRVEVAAINVVGGTETVGTEATTSYVVPGSEIVSATREAVNVVDVGVTMITNQQILKNGDLLYGNPAGNAKAWRKSALPFSGGTGCSVTTTDDVHWIANDHYLKWISNSSGIYAPLQQRIVPSEFLTFTFLARTTGSITPIIDVKLRDTSNNDRTVAGAQITLSGLTSSYKVFSCTIQRVSTSPSANEFLELRTATAISSTNHVQMDRFMLVRGKQPAAFSPRVESFELDESGTTEDPDVTAVAITNPDIGASSGGSQGGGFSSGSGGEITIQTV